MVCAVRGVEARDGHWSPKWIVWGVIMVVVALGGEAGGGRWSPTGIVSGVIVGFGHSDLVRCPPCVAVSSSPSSSLASSVVL